MTAIAFIIKNGDTMPADDHFVKDVYKLVNSIPAGKVLTYGAVAALCGRPANSRQVGRLMSDAPPGVCAHRVVNASGRTAPGWHEQRALLESEGIAFRENGFVDLRRHLWTK